MANKIFILFNGKNTTVTQRQDIMKIKAFLTEKKNNPAS